jgi:hypothetical protein
MAAEKSFLQSLFAFGFSPAPPFSLGGFGRSAPPLAPLNRRAVSIAINAWECGSKQDRLRHVQFGSLDGVRLVIPRKVTVAIEESQPTVCASGYKKSGPSLPDACELQGLPRDFRMPRSVTRANLQSRR